MQTKIAPDAVRFDIFSVKADVRDGAGETHVYMSYQRSDAKNMARDIRNDHSLGLNRLARIVHPKQWVVEAYVMVGNKVDGIPLP